MRIRAPFKHGSVLLTSREIYFEEGVSSDLPEEVASTLLSRPGFSRYIPPKPKEEIKVIPSSKEYFVAPPVEKDKGVIEEITNKYFSKEESYLLKSNPYFKVYPEYFTFSVALNRDNIDVSIIIPTRNRKEDLGNCIMSIYKNTHGLTYEIIVVDGSDLTDTFDSICRHASVFVVRELIGAGTIKAFNRGFMFAEGKYIAWLNDDVTVEKDWLNIAYEFMENNKDVSLGSIYHKEGALQFGKMKPVLGYIWDGDYCVRTLAHYTKHPGMVYANFGIIEKDLFREMGFWNERDYKSYVADTDLSHRVWDRGLKVSPIFGSRVVHLYKHDDLRKENVRVYKKEREHYESVWGK